MEAMIRPLPPPHDPAPDRPWRPWRKTDRGWWCDPRLPLPALGDLSQAAEPARDEGGAGHYPASHEGAARWALLAALLDCAANFYGPRAGRKRWDATGNEDRRRFALELGRLCLRRFRAERCVRPVAGAPGPRNFAAALARLRALVQMCDPSDAEGERYWVERVRDESDLARSVEGMVKQLSDGKWVRLEQEWEARYGG
ncbi:MAG: hypothetical protein QME60_01410 [Verrucomicrobiota bacterium]|nr:hypothetical protein [Verrucomicrobiota bacterium]